MTSPLGRGAGWWRTTAATPAPTSAAAAAATQAQGPRRRAAGRAAAGRAEPARRRGRRTGAPHPAPPRPVVVGVLDVAGGHRGVPGHGDRTQLQPTPASMAESCGGDRRSVLLVRAPRGGRSTGGAGDARRPL